MWCRMEPEIIAAMGTIIVAMAAAIGKLLLDTRHNNVPRDNHQSNPGPVDLRTTKLGDMSAAWYEEKHKELLEALENLTATVKGTFK